MCAALLRYIRLRASRRASFFFFFQAEDGIRDYKVTGVQTCALPIYAHADRERARDLDARETEVGLHGAEQNREAVVEDAPRDRLGDAESGHDDPAVDRKSVV